MGRRLMRNIPFFAGSEEDDGNNEETENLDDDNDTDDAGGDESGEEVKNPKIKRLSDENARHRNENKQLKDELAAAQARLKEIDDADKSELEKATSDLSEMTTKYNDLKTNYNTLQLQNAFLMANSVVWHDPSIAIKELDTTDLVAEDGTVDTKVLKTRIADLAKSKPFLVKESDDDAGGTPPASGSNVGGSRRVVKDADRAALEKKYPALRK